MPVIDFDAERAYNDERFSAQETFQTERTKVVCAYFEPGQFIPVHAPGSDVVVDIRRGTGIVREDETTHKVSPGDTVAVEAGTDRGIRAEEDGRLETLLVTTPPPTDEEHGPVREGLGRGVFDPTAEDAE